MSNDPNHDYNNLANWAGNVIDDSFAGVTFATNTTLYFSANRTAAAGLNLNYSGNVDLTFVSNSTTPMTLTLGGPIAGDFGGAANQRFVYLGSSTNPLNIDMSGAGTFNVAGSGDTLVVSNVISNGSLTKTGPGTLNLRGNSTYTGATNIQAGSLTLGGVPVVPAGAGGHYTFDSTSGTGVNSKVFNSGTLGAADDGMLQANATIAVGAGLRGTNALALTSNGSNDYMQINPGLPLGNQWTASAWFNNMFAPGSWRTLFRASIGDSDHQVIVQAGGTTLGMYNNSGIGPCCFQGLSPNYDVNTGGSGVGGISTGWHQLTVVGYGSAIVGGNGLQNFFIDGQYVGTVFVGSNSNIFAVGNYQGGGQAFAPILDEVYIYQSGLNPSQVADLYNATAPTPPPAPGAASFISSSSAVIVAAGATFNTNGYTISIGSLAGSGSVLLGSATLTVGGDGTSTTFSGVISGTGSVIKVGGGTFTLSGAETYTGGTTVNGGSLVQSGSLATGLVLNSGTNTINGTIAGSVSLTSGTLVVNGTVNGNLTLNGGGDTINGTIAGSVTLSSGTLAVNGTVNGNLTLSGGGDTLNGKVGGNVALNSGSLTGTGTASGSLSVGAAILNPGANVGTLSVGGNLTLGSGSTLAIQLAGAGSNNQVKVNGSATLGNAALSLSVQFRALPAQTFTVLTAAGGVSGQLTFNGVALSDGSFFTVGSTRFRINYTGTSVVLTSFGTAETPIYAIGADAGMATVASILNVTGQLVSGSSLVSVYNASNQLIDAFNAFPPNFTGGVRVAVGDVQGNGIPDIICAAGPGGGPEVVIYDGTTFRPIQAFFAFAPTFTGGLFVAAGDLYGNGYDDIIIGADAGGLAEVEIFDGRTDALVTAFFPFGQFATVKGVRVAVGDVNADGYADIICAAGPGGLPQVTIFDGRTLNVLGSVLAYPVSFTGGVWVAAGDVNGDNRADIITGAGPGGTPLVEVFDGVTHTPLMAFNAYPANFRGGVRVAARDLTGNGIADIITGAGPTGLPEVTTLDGSTLSVLGAFFAYNPGFRGGVFVG
jgi:autotransporter-associated beta strand protein